MLLNYTYTANPKTCLKNPAESTLGRRILSESIQLIDEIGLEQFTFRKLANKIGSTEASVYRYFENKHKLLLYLVNWYWSWLANKIVTTTHHLSCPQNKLDTAIGFLASPISKDESIGYIDEIKLYKIIISESPKAYLVKEVDKENLDGVYLAYKGLCNILASFMISINPMYRHAHSLATTIIETCHNQVFFSLHLPRLTDLEHEDYSTLKEFIIHLTTSTLFQNKI